MPGKKVVQEESKVSKGSGSDSSPNQSDIPKLKRPPTAYILFTTAKRAEVKSKNPDMKTKDIMTELGKLWQLASSEEKQHFNALSEAEKEKYNKLKSERGEDTKVGKRKDTSDSDTDNKKRKATKAKPKSKK